MSTPLDGIKRDAERILAGASALEKLEVAESMIIWQREKLEKLRPALREALDLVMMLVPTNQTSIIERVKELRKLQ